VLTTPNTTRRSGNIIAAAKIDARKYGRLLARTLPVAIDTLEEHRYMLAEVDKLFEKDLSPEEAKLFDLMVTLIEDYEDKHFQLNAATPLTILLARADGEPRSKAQGSLGRDRLQEPRIGNIERPTQDQYGTGQEACGILQGVR
jgi:hypothetical protein